MTGSWFTTPGRPGNGAAVGASRAFRFTRIGAEDAYPDTEEQEQSSLLPRDHRNPEQRSVWLRVSARAADVGAGGNPLGARSPKQVRPLWKIIRWGADQPPWDKEE
jgi:hypothetical protein